MLGLYEEMVKRTYRLYRCFTQVPLLASSFSLGSDPPFIHVNPLNDLVSMGAALALLEKGFYGTLSGEAKEEAHKLFQRAGKIIGMLEDAIAHALALKSELGLQTEPVNLIKDILEPLFQELCHDISRERILVIFHPPELVDKSVRRR